MDMVKQGCRLLAVILILSINAPIAAAVPDSVSVPGSIPFFVTPNVGQADKAILYQGAGMGGRIDFFKDAFIVSWTASEPGPAPEIAARGKSDARPPKTTRSNAIRFELTGTNSPRIHGQGPLPTRVHYLNGETGINHTDIEAYSRLVYENIYPGVDLVFYERNGDLEFDFIVSPGVDPQIISMNIAGGEAWAIDTNGDLAVQVNGDGFVLQRPVMYQKTETGRIQVDGGFEIDQSGRICFTVGDYQPDRPLVIDPVALFSHYIGGGNSDGIRAIEKDSQGRIIVAGFAASAGLSSAGYADKNGGKDAIVGRYSTFGELEFLTYFGGAQDDMAYGLALDSNDRIYIVGETYSELGSGEYSAVGIGDAFVARLEPDGAEVDYVMCLAGFGPDVAYDVAVDDLFQAYVVGETWSSDFLDGAGGSIGDYNNQGDIFIVKLFSIGNGHFYSRYIGGSGSDAGLAVGLYKNNDVIIAGSTESADFPAIDDDESRQTRLRGTKDGFLIWLRNSDGAPRRSTYFGYDGEEQINDVLVKRDDEEAWITGWSTSNKIPYSNKDRQGPSDMFVASVYLGSNFNPYELAVLGVSKRYGGSGDDYGQGYRPGPTGYTTIYVAGSTNSPDLPALSNDSSHLAGGWDAFAAIIELHPAIDENRVSYYYGGAGDETCYAMTIDERGSFILAGETNSSNILSSIGGSPPTAYGGAGDGFLTSLKPGSAFGMYKSTPSNQAKDIHPSTELYLFFNREINQDTIEGKVTLHQENQDNSIKANAYCGSQIHAIVVSPDRNLARDSWYTLKVDEGVTDLYGETSPAYEIRFKTEAESDSNPGGCFVVETSH